MLSVERNLRTARRSKDLPRPSSLRLVPPRATAVPGPLGVSRPRGWGTRHPDSEADDHLPRSRSAVRLDFKECVKRWMNPKSPNSVRSFIGGFSRHDREFALVLLIVQELETIGGYLETKEGQFNEQSDYILQLADRCIRGNQPRHFTIPC